MVSNPFSGEGLSVNVGGDASGATSALSGLQSSLGLTKAKVVGLGGALAGALAVGGMAKAISAAADFDEKMQESMAVMGDVSDTMREDLEVRAREVANTTKASAETAAESYYFLASAGLDAAESLEAMPKVAAFAQAGNLEMAKATDYATDIMKGFGKEADDLTRVTDRLTATVTRHNQTMEGMGEAMSMVAPIASGLGVSIAETSTLIGTLGDAGIKGSRAGRTLRQAFKKLTDVSGPAQEKLDELGVSVEDSEGNMRDMTAIIRDLNAAGASTADVMEIFGARAGPGMQVLLDQGAESLEDETEKIAEMQGITEEVADEQMQTFNAQLGLLKDQLNDVAIEIGKNLLPPLTKLLKVTMRGVDAFSRLNKKTDGMLGTLSLVAGGLAGIVTAGAVLISTLGGVSAIVAGLGVAFTVLTGPIGLAIAAIALLAAAWSSNLGGIQEKTKAVFGFLKETIGSALSFINEEIIQPVLTMMSNTWTEHGEEITGEIGETVEALMGYFNAAMEFIAPLVEMYLDYLGGLWSAWGDEIMLVVDFAFSTILGVLQTAFDFILTAFEVVLNLIQGDWEEAWNAIAGFLMDTLTGLLEFGAEWGSKFVDALIENLPDTLKGAVRDAIGAAGDMVTPNIEATTPDVQSQAPTQDGGPTTIKQEQKIKFEGDGEITQLMADEANKQIEDKERQTNRNTGRRPTPTG